MWQRLDPLNFPLQRISLAIASYKYKYVLYKWRDDISGVCKREFSLNNAFPPGRMVDGGAVIPYYTIRAPPATTLLQFFLVRFLFLSSFCIQLSTEKDAIVRDRESLWWSRLLQQQLIPHKRMASTTSVCVCALRIARIRFGLWLCRK